MAEEQITQQHCRGADCLYQDQKEGRIQIRCIMCCIWHHSECVDVKKEHTKQVWTCLSCRKMVPAVFKMQKELKDMKENQMKLLQMVEKMT